MRDIHGKFVRGHPPLNKKDAATGRFKAKPKTAASVQVEMPQPVIETPMKISTEAPEVKKISLLEELHQRYEAHAAHAPAPEAKPEEKPSDPIIKKPYKMLQRMLEEDES
jgi:hypothetical protein